MPDGLGKVAGNGGGAVREGGRGGPSTIKKKVINIHISSNLRRMKKENNKFVILMQ